MNRCLSFMLFLLIASFSNAQNCLPSGITFTSQADVDAFPTNYPNCTEIDGDVRIGYYELCFNSSGTPTDISNLDSLMQITTIHGSLSISINPNLIDLTGLEGLINIDNHLRIFCNDNLLNLNGLNNLVSVGGTTSIGNGSAGFGGNAKLQNLTGLSNLISPSLSIVENSSFKNFIGLNPISSLQTLTVTNCDSLENFIGLESLTTINSNFTLVRNNSNFDFVGLGNITTIGGNLFLDRNDNQNFHGLLNLNEIEGSLEIFEGNFLTSFDGLDNLATIESFTLVFTNSLTSLDGLDNWTNFASPNDNFNNHIDLFNNASLNDISAISSLDTTGLDDIQIVLNSMLSECAIKLVCDFLDENSANTTISTNMAGCNSNADVETACSALPVYYSEELKAYSQNKSVLLTFSVSQQINNLQFQIHHSMDAKEFYQIGIIEGETYSSSEINYSFLHKNPQEGKNYYRINQVNIDGSSLLSNIAQISYKDELNIIVYPNPASTRISINTSEGKEVFIYSLQGELMLQKIITTNGINISNLSNGIYLYSIDGFTEKLVKIN